MPGTEGDGNDANLRLDYAETMATWRHLVEVRFKLLALVPTLSAAGVGIFGGRDPSYASAATALVAVVAIAAVAVYELRNSMFHDAAIHRAKTLEARLGLRRSSQDLDEALKVTPPRSPEGGVFADRPRRRLKLFRVLPVWHDVALWLVYSASIAGWAAVALHAFAAQGDWTTPFDSPWSYAAVGAPAAGLVWLAGLVQYGRRWDSLIQAGLLPPDKATGEPSPG